MVDDPRSAVQFLVWWVAVYFLPFSLVVQTKLPNYILPLYPAMALLTAYFLDQWRRGLVHPPRWAVTGSVACLALMGVGVAAALLVAGGVLDVPRLRGRTLADLGPWSGLGGVLLAAAAAAWWCLWREWRGAVVGVVAATALVFTGAMAAWGVAAVDRYKAPRALVQQMPADQTLRDVRVATFDYFQPSLVFYCQREVERLEAAYQVLDFLGGPLPSYLFLPARRWEQLSPLLGRSYRLVARHHDLYDGRDIVVVTNE